MQPCDGGRARDGQRAGALARGIAHFAVAEDIVLVGAGDLHAAHPHGVFGDGGGLSYRNLSIAGIGNSSTGYFNAACGCTGICISKRGFTAYVVS